MAIRYPITLSTTEPNNDVGLIKIRQADEQSQTLDVQLTESSQPKSYGGLQVFFCAKLGQSLGLGIIEQKLDSLEMTNPKAGQFEYTFRPEDWQQIGRQTGYFSFRKMKDDHEYVEQFTTRDFYFNVTKNVFSEGIKEIHTDGSTHIWTIEDLIRLFNEYIASGKSDWEQFIEDNREILESVDPGGTVLQEIIDARGDEGSLKDRIDGLIKYTKQLVPMTSDVPDDRLTQVLNFKNRINTDPSVLKINYYRDLHYMESIKSEYGESTAKSLDQLKCGAVLADVVDLAVLNGDNVHDDENINLTRLRNKQVGNVAYEAMGGRDTFISLGNHDDHSVYGFGAIKDPRPIDQTIRLDEFNSLWQVDMHDFGESRPDGKTYCFKDYPDQKIRVVILDGFESPELIENGNTKYPRVSSSIFDSDQINWFANEALQNVPDGYAVIAFTHAPLAGFFNNKPYSNYTNIGHELILGIANAFQQGTGYSGIESNADYPSTVDVDYSRQGTRDFIGFVFGHEHWDAASPQIFNGVRGIMRTSNLCAGTTPTRQIETDTEFAMDIIEIDQNAKKCVFKRCGAGNDLMIEY
ncbi:BppU family phage baseplate upper protein [Enterococcus asini]|uniref:BppU family phage baseplate upper protein n=1 Tax=Enterococcus asini TaxID=57732 RepID=UPI0032E4D8F7